MIKHIAFLLLLAFTSLPTLALEKKEIYADWGVYCEQNTEGKNKCYMIQEVSQKKEGSLLARIRIGFSGKDKQPATTITVPLGTYLPTGTMLLVKDADPLETAFFSCTNQGCTSLTTPMDKKLIQAMKMGDKASIRIANTAKKVIAIPISLNGFTKSHASALALEGKPSH